MPRLEGDASEDLGPVADPDAKFWGAVKRGAPYKNAP